MAKYLIVGDVITDRDKLVLSLGAEPVRPPLVGIDTPGIFTLRNVTDADRIRNFVDTKKPRRLKTLWRWNTPTRRRFQAPRTRSTCWDSLPRTS